MATQKNAVVTTIDAGTILRPNEYLGVVRSIPVELTGDFADTDTLEFSKTLAQNTKLIAIHLTNTDMGTSVSVDIGYTGDPDAIIDGADVSSAGTVDYQGVAVDVSNKAIVGTVKGNWDSGSLTGYILVVTDW